MTQEPHSTDAINSTSLRFYTMLTDKK